jgi:formate hydrogenlyase subunit 6/NADH:ubiquinone oxidoreductase subunit I
MTLDFLPQIDSAKCIGCDLCVRLCPTQALSMIRGIAAVTAPDMCTYSGVCQEICPTQAISLAYEIIFSTAGKGKEKK